MNIQEGADHSQMPRFIGWGRILTADWLTEHYFTLCLFGWRLFLVRCHSRWPTAEASGYWRWWLQRVR